MFRFVACVIALVRDTISQIHKLECLQFINLTKKGDHKPNKSVCVIQVYIFFRIRPISKGKNRRDKSNYFFQTARLEKNDLSYIVFCSIYN